MFHLESNQEVFGGIDIANPNESIKPEDRLWDNFVKNIELFPETRKETEW